MHVLCAQRMRMTHPYLEILLLPLAFVGHDDTRDGLDTAIIDISTSSQQQQHDEQHAYAAHIDSHATHHHTGLHTTRCATARARDAATAAQAPAL